MKDLTVFILTHNRGEMLLETIDSVLNQTCHDFKFVVSDNSSNDETARLLQERNLLGKFEYRKRDKEYSSVDHFNMCLSEVDTEYFVLFHDDDIMLPEYVETMYNTINGSEYVAVGCNARYLIERNVKRKMFVAIRNVQLNYPKELSARYCIRKIAPFPAYIYNRKLVDACFFDYKLGKYSDVNWLLRLSNQHKIKWIKKSLMFYRLHALQDSAKKDYISLWRLYKSFSDSGCAKKLINYYRLYNLYSEAIKKKKFCLYSFLLFFSHSKITACKYFFKLAF